MDNNSSCDQLIVRVWKACNFWCNFCNVADNERNIKMKENIDDIVRNFHYKLKYSNFQSGKLTVTISWGEPSLFKKETIFALKYIKRILDKKWIESIFEIQTNASYIDADFAYKIAQLGIKVALVSFHMIDPAIFEHVIQVPYESNYHKIIEWIEHLHNAWITVYTNTILSRETQDNFYPTIEFLLKRFPFIELYNIGLIQPHGEANKVLDAIYPRYTEIALLYNKAIFFLKSKWKEVVSHFVWPPACYMASFSSSLEVSQNALFRRNFNFTDRYLINNINDNNKKQTKECDSCLYNNVCSGIWNEYLSLQTLKPLYYIRDFSWSFQIDANAYKMRDLHENIKSVFDRNIRQIIIPSSLGSKTDIYTLLKKATKIGFYKITLYIDDDFFLEEDIFYTWVNNIQWNIESFEHSFIEKLLIFSRKHAPQFRIDIDLFQRYKTEQTMRYIKYLPSKFLKLYFIYDFSKKNQEIYSYRPLLRKLFVTGSLFSMNFDPGTSFYKYSSKQ